MFYGLVETYFSLRDVSVSSPSLLINMWSLQTMPIVTKSKAELTAAVHVHVISQRLRGHVAQLRMPFAMLGYNPIAHIQFIPHERPEIVEL
jgi:hypothetical protein